MSTPVSVKQQIQKLINDANVATGNTDTDLTSAVGSLIDGYGSGGGGSVELQDKIITENGSYTADEGYSGLGTVTVDVAGETPTDVEKKWIAHIERNDTAIYRIPNGLKKIGNYTFCDCSNLMLSELPSEITEIGASAFSSCSNLALTSIPEGVTNINASTFMGCVKLALTKLPNGITEIGASAFRACTNLALTSIPEGVNTIGAYAFMNCAGLIELTFKGTPTSIAATAFNNCNKLLVINVPWSEGAVANAPWGATKATINYNYTGE